MLDSGFSLDDDGCRRLLLERLKEPAPSRIQILTGPRQVGKTTLFLDLANHFGEHAQYVAGDDPQAGLPGFWDRTWSEAEQRTQHGSAVLLLDEVQHIADWGRCLKGQYDRLRRLRASAHG